MNKLQKIIISAVLSIIYSGTVHAAVGDIAGNLYYTDIITYIYHAPITSYNIGGRTVIDAEILNRHYGFDVYWHDDTRRLEITDKGGEFNSLEAMNGSLVEETKGNIGDISYNYYKTDIITTLNGEEIESYNINGRTFFVAEDMRNFGYNVEWNEAERTLTISKPSDFYRIESDYGVIKSKFIRTHPMLFARYKRGLNIINESGNVQYQLPFASGALTSDVLLSSTDSTGYVRLAEVEKALNAKCTLVEMLETAHNEWVNGISYDDEEYTYKIEFDYDEYTEFELHTSFDTEFDMIVFHNAYEILPVFIVNGTEFAFKPRRFSIQQFHTLILDGEMYIPAQAVAEMLGYDYAY